MNPNSRSSQAGTFGSENNCAAGQPYDGADAPERALRHRLMNLVSVIQAMIRLSARDATDVETYSSELAARINALALAHGGGTAANGASGVSFRALVQQVMSPHVPANSTPLLEGPDFDIPEPSVAALALILHELSANARKRGGWAHLDGQVRVTWWLERCQRQKSKTVRLSWTEFSPNFSNGSLPACIPDGSFASLLIKTSLSQLGGSISRDTAPCSIHQALEFTI